MTPQPIRIFTVQPDGRIAPIGHNQPQQPGDLVRDPATNSLYRLIIGRGGFHLWYIGPLASAS